MRRTALAIAIGLILESWHYEAIYRAAELAVLRGAE
jgi:hypothetical protein